MAVANPSSIKQARSHSLPDDQVSLDQISNTIKCGKFSKQEKEDAIVKCCEFRLSSITLNVQIFLMKFTNS